MFEKLPSFGLLTEKQLRLLTSGTPVSDGDGIAKGHWAACSHSFRPMILLSGHIRGVLEKRSF